MGETAFDPQQSLDSSNPTTTEEKDRLSGVLTLTNYLMTNLAVACFAPNEITATAFVPAVTL